MREIWNLSQIHLALFLKDQLWLKLDYLSPLERTDLLTLEVTTFFQPVNKHFISCLEKEDRKTNHFVNNPKKSYSPVPVSQIKTLFTVNFHKDKQIVMFWVCWKHSSFLYIYLTEPLKDIFPLGYINIYNPICRTWQQ